MAQQTSDYFGIGEWSAQFINYPVDASTTIPAGTMVCVSTATSGAGANGLLTPASATAGFRFVGISQQNVVNNGTSGGEVTCQVQPVEAMSTRCFTVNATSPTNAWVGQAIKIVDNVTGGLVGTNLGSATTIIIGRCNMVASTAAAGSIVVDGTLGAGYLGSLSGGTNGITTGTAW